MSNRFSATAKGLTRGAGAALAGRLVSGVATLAISLLVARALSPEHAGRYFSMIAFARLLAVIGDLGMGQSIIALQGEEVAARGRPNRAVMAKGWRIALLGVSATCIAAFAGAATLVPDVLLEPGNGLGWAVLALLAIAWAAALLAEDSLRSVAAIEFATGTTTLLPVTTAALLVAAAVAGIHLNLANTLMLATAGAIVSAAFGLAATAATTYRESAWSSPSVGRYLGIGLPFLASTLLTMGFLSGAVLVAAGIAGDRAAAQYAIAFRLAVWVGVPLAIANFAIAPYVSSLYRKAEGRRLEQIVRSATTVAAIPATALVIVLTLFGGAILSVLFGPAYESANAPMIVLAFAFGIDVILGPGGLILTLSGHQRLYLVLVAGAFCAAFPLMIWLASIAGALGVSIGAGTGIVLLNIMTTLAVRRSVGIWPPMYTRRESIASVGRSVLRTVGEGRKGEV